MPTLSVCISSYNYGRYIRTALRSILSQDFKPLEIIIVEDASTDNSLSVIQEEVKGHSNVKVIVHNSNKGILFCMNELFSVAKGDFVYGLAADDLVCPCFLEKIMGMVDRHPEAGILCCNIGVFFNDDTSSFREYPIKTPSGKFPQKEYFFTSEEVIDIFRKTRLTIHGQACVYKRELVLQYGGFSADLSALCDWYLAHKIALEHGMSYIPEPLVLTRVHDASFSAQAFKLSKRWALNNSILRKIEKEKAKRAMNRSVLLIQLGIPMIISLLFYPKLWHFYPLLLVKKVKNIMEKLLCVEF